MVVMPAMQRSASARHAQGGLQLPQLVLAVPQQRLDLRLRVHERRPRHVAADLVGFELVAL